MSSVSSLDSKISVDPYTDSLNSKISVEHDSSVALSELEGCSSEDVVSRDSPCTSSMLTPICFKRVPRRVSYKRLEYLTSECPILMDIAKRCCLLNCMARIGKKGLSLLRQCYFSLNGEEQDTFLVARLQLVNDSSLRNTISFDYYLNMNDKCCHQAFKIVLGVGNMRLNRVQQRCLFGYSVYETPVGEISGRGLVGQNGINWIQNY